jgi:hypothetical protein
MVKSPCGGFWRRAIYSLSLPLFCEAPPLSSWVVVVVQPGLSQVDYVEFWKIREVARITWGKSIAGLVDSDVARDEKSLPVDWICAG